MAKKSAPKKGKKFFFGCRNDLPQGPFPCYSLPVSNTTAPVMTIEEIVRETVAFYSDKKNSRSVAADGSCSYLNKRGDSCAVGRCIEEDCLAFVAECEEKHGEFNVLNFETRVGTKLEENLKEQYLGHSVRFWSKLQILHDMSWHWVGNVLTEAGKTYIREEFGFEI